MQKIILLSLTLVVLSGCTPKTDGGWYYSTAEQDRKVVRVESHTNPELWVGVYYEGDMVPSVTIYYDDSIDKYSIHRRDGRATD